MVLSVILPICLLLLLGFICVKFDFILAEHIKGLSQFVFKISLPAFLLQALASKRFDEIWNSSYFIAYGNGSLIIFALAFLLYQIFPGGNRTGVVHGFHVQYRFYWHSNPDNADWATCSNLSFFDPDY